MKSYQPNPSSRSNNMAHQPNNMQRGQEEAYYSPFSLSWFISRLITGLNRLLIALKHKAYTVAPGGRIEGRRLPWLKIGLAAFVLFLMTKKDLQFSVNMRAPLRTASMEEPQATGVSLRQGTMSLGQNLLFKGSSTSAAVEELDAAAVKAYVKRFSKVAIAEMQKYGMPASIKMAQAILESKGGTSRTVSENNNHFGGPLSNKTYTSAWENWRTHSLLLKSSFPDAFENGKSYKKWATALKGYNSDRNYDGKLLQVIETYQLYLLDEEF